MRERLSSGPPCLTKNTLVSSLHCLQQIKSTAAPVTAADRQIQGLDCLLLECMLLILRSLKAKYKNPLACSSSLSLQVL